MPRDKRDKFHIDDNFAMVDLDVAMAMRRLALLKLLLLLAIVLPMYVKLSVVVTGCVPMSVDGEVGIHGLKDFSLVLDQLTCSPSFWDCSLNINRASFSVSNISAKITTSSA